MFDASAANNTVLLLMMTRFLTEFGCAVEINENGGTGEAKKETAGVAMKTISIELIEGQKTLVFHKIGLRQEFLNLPLKKFPKSLTAKPLQPIFQTRMGGSKKSIV
ncbi:MAG: hypothetical protein U0003_01505 [Vampirovibrionales bacterium]